MQVFDCLLKCYINYAFTMHEKACEDEAPLKVESINNEFGCHGGNIQI